MVNWGVGAAVGSWCALLLIPVSHVTLGKSLTLSEAQFSCLQTPQITASCLGRFIHSSDKYFWMASVPDAFFRDWGYNWEQEFLPLRALWHGGDGK